MTQRVLCLGNNSEDTDRRARDLAHQRSLPCHGLLSELDGPLSAPDYESPGVYHSSVFDIPPPSLRALAAEFDEVVMLAQPYQHWSHANAILDTLAVMQDLPCRCYYQDPGVLEQHRYWQDLVTSNPSFCIFPWINSSINQDHATVCCRSDRAVSSLYPGWQLHQDANMAQVRHDMVNGTPLPQYCGGCYHREQQGMISARQQQTVIWAHRLNLQHVSDLDNVNSAASYDIRVGDVCNLMCRMCSPDNSHLIHREHTKLGLTQNPRKPSVNDPFEWVDIHQAQRVYVTGGEPTISSMFLDWLVCVRQIGRTDMEILINTNAYQFSDRFTQLIGDFSNLQFIVSLDAWGMLNDYIRWPSRFITVRNNINYLVQKGHRISINTTISIYNISRLPELLSGISDTWPQAAVSTDIVSDPWYLSPMLWPDRNQASEVLAAAMATPCGQNNKAVFSTLLALKHQFQESPTSPGLDQFFEFNHKLDASRGVDVRDYLPDLARHRTPS